MKKKIGLWLAVALLWLAPEAEAQKWKEYVKNKQEVVKERVGQKVDERINRKIEEKVDDGLDRVFDGSGNNPDANGGQTDGMDVLNNLNVGSTTKLDKVYDFDLEVDYKMDAYKRNGKLDESMPYTMLLAKGKRHMASKVAQEGVEALSIVDMEEQYSLTITSAGMAILMRFDGIIDDANEGATDGGDAGDFKIERTGRREQIAGYSCEQIIVSAEGTTSELWMTTELNYDMMATMSGMTMANVAQFKRLSGHEIPAGMMMRMVTVEDGEKLVMEATKVRKKSSSVDMSRYSVRDMSGLMKSASGTDGSKPAVGTGGSDGTGDQK